MERERSPVLEYLPKRSVGAELGVWKGNFSAQLLEALQPTRLYLIDPWQINEDAAHKSAWYGSKKRPDMHAIYEGVLRRFEKERQQGSVVILRQPSSAGLRAIPDNSLDFVYIDGDHEYTAARTDCFLAYEKIKAGGVICGDDYVGGKWWKDGVIRAFHDLICERNVVIAFCQGEQIILQKRNGDYDV